MTAGGGGVAMRVMVEGRGYPGRFMDEPSDQKRAGPQVEDRPEVPSRPRGRVRITSLAGTVSALLMGLCFFLNWVEVSPRLGEAFRDGIEEAVAEKDEKSPVEEDFQALADTLASEGALTGMDLIHWVRTAGAFGREIKGPREREADAPTQRALVVARLLLNGLLFVGFLLAAYFVFHGFRRVTSPVLILCILVGTSAVVLAGGLHYAHHLVLDALGSAADGVANGIGSKVLLLGGAGLVLAGVFGVSARNFVRVYAGVACTAGALYVLTLRYFESGTLP
jgi:hypothetical protein